ncbi:hypothetical protein V2A60_004066 [Cordyceps javanica]
MEFFDKNLNRGSRVESSDSSGDATPTPKTPTNTYLPQNRRPTQSPLYSRPQPITTGHADGSTPRQSLRHIWEDANRPAQPTSAIPQTVYSESPNNPDYSSASTQRRRHGIPAYPYVGNDERNLEDWETGMQNLRLEGESRPRPSQASVDASKRLKGSSYPYSVRPDAASAIPQATEMTSPVRHLSIWSAYGNQPNSNIPSPSGSFTPMSALHLSSSAPRPARTDTAPLHQSRANSETCFNTSTNLTQPRQSCASQLSTPIPMRMGQSQHRIRELRAPSGPESNSPVPFHLQPRQQGGFLPMHAIWTGREPPPCSAPAHTPSVNVYKPAPSNRFSDRYHGMHTESNASAEHLSAEQNASLWVTNLPPDTTHHQLLGQIRGIGRIWCCFINGPDGVKHSTAAAKIVFFRPGAAQRLLRHALEHDGLQVGGLRARVTQNRIKTGETTPRDGDESRVLIVTGQAHLVNEPTLTEYFGQRFVFQLDEVRVLARSAGRAVLEFRFGSYRCQAQMGKISLEKDRPLGFEKAEFGDDPCEVGETKTSETIAWQRIRGIGI